MTPESWRRLNEVFQAVLERDPSGRAAFLDEACGGDGDLRHEIDSLLAAHEGATGFLGAPSSEVEAPPPALAPGARLGRYEVQGPVGAGGMGEVYRARDESLGREVAVKVLPRAFCADPDRLRRFEQEARAAGRLNHPHVLAVYDVGQQDGIPYIVSELLDGMPLRERLEAGPLPVTKAVEIAAQIAKGLAAVHARDIVHRDLKPDNVFVTRDGHVKLLDFGLARAVHPRGDGGTGSLSAHTTPGLLLGTLGYMSPEQVRGEPADARSDVFALGAILFEMLAGRRAFRRATPAETLAAILQDDPVPDLESLGRVGAPLVRVVRHCLEKQPDERYQSARDLVFELDGFLSMTASRPGATVARARFPRRWLALPLLLLPALAAAYLLGARRVPSGVPSYRQLTFRRGTVDAARFSPDGNTIYYSAAWEGRPDEVFSTRLDGLESRSLGLVGARLVATAPGEMAVLRESGETRALARVPLEGGSPRDVLADVIEADWSPDGRQLAVVKATAGRVRLEFPPGRTVYETAGSLVTPRVSPDGREVAVVDQSMLGNTLGGLVLVDADGRARALSEGWSDIGGAAWTPDGREIWFTAARAGNARTLHAVTREGRYRLVGRTPATMVLQDVSSRGQALLTHAHERCDAYGALAADTSERDFSWYDWTHVTFLAPDARQMLFTAEGQGGGPLYTVYLRSDPDAAPVRLGEGHGTEISPDGRQALCLVASRPPALQILPTGAGETKTLASSRTFAELHWAWWFPDGRRVLFLANVAGHPAQLFVQDLAGGAPRPLATEGVTAYRQHPITPDGRRVLVLAPGPPRPRFVLWPVDGGEPVDVPGLDARDRPLQWSDDGGSLYVRRPGAVLPVGIDRLDLRSGQRVLWRELRPADPAGVRVIGDVVIDPGGRGYVYNCQRTLSELYLTEGLR